LFSLYSYRSAQIIFFIVDVSEGIFDSKKWLGSLPTLLVYEIALLEANGEIDGQ